ncbi:hypothetical protein PLEOSDRAFT_1102923 [Pleurotus ostreatus PC15]|uniref:Uncharacterized protein n=1 Tax=Pleurotus ostreatus (strain PC15) TaxID=1137138 RepID=A0A067NPH2_PLEO1|nr:hypothetical protein PLEOSDRAFT_1102923 [Pleurotus ostreatus PC15]
MISATSFRWYFVPLFILCLRLALPAFFLVNGAFAFMSKSACYVVYILVWVFGLLINAFGTVNAVLALAVSIWPFWFYLNTATSGDSKAHQGHQQQHPETLEDDFEERPGTPIPDLEEDLDYDPLPEPIPTHRRRHRKSKRRDSSKGGGSTTALPTTGAGTSSARSSNGTFKSNGDSPGYGHGYGQPLVPPITSDNSFYYGKRWFHSCKAASSTFRTRSTMSGYVQVRRQSSKDPSLPISSSPVLERLELVPVPAAPKDTHPHLPPPPPTLAGPRVPEYSIPLFAPLDKPRRTSQEGPSSTPHQRPSNRLARWSNKTSRPLALSTSGLPEALPSPFHSTQHAYSPMIVEVEHDESLVLTHRLELLSSNSLPPSPRLVKMASPIIDHNTRDTGLAVAFSELAAECDEYSDYSDDSMDIDDSDFSDSDSMDSDSPMDVDPVLREVDVDMDAWHHPPVESPFLGNRYAPSLRYRFTGLSLAPSWEDPYHDHNMLVDTC